MTEPKLFLENGGEAGFYDVLRWLVNHYPPDIFIEEPGKEFIAFRDWALNLLEERESDLLLKQQLKCGELE